MAPKKKAKKAAKPAARKAAPKKSAKKAVAPIPPGFHTLTPYLVCRDAAQAMEFYRKALGAKEKARMVGPDGKIMHAEMTIGNSIVMLGDENTAMGMHSPQHLGGVPGGVFIYTPNVDKLYAQAIAAGATPEAPPMDMFWGDRYCKFADPYGHKWSAATHIEDLSMKEMMKRSEAYMAQQAGGPKP